MPASFFDSNVPLYLAAKDKGKAIRALDLLTDGGIISVQVLNEATNVALRKFDFTVPEVRDFTTRLCVLVEVVPVTVEIHELAMWVREKYRFAFYDCAIIGAALFTDCDTLWSEDMHDGLVIDGRLTIRNPFVA